MAARAGRPRARTARDRSDVAASVARRPGHLRKSGTSRSSSSSKTTGRRRPAFTSKTLSCLAAAAGVLPPGPRVACRRPAARASSRRSPRLSSGETNETGAGTYPDGAVRTGLGGRLRGLARPAGRRAGRARPAARLRARAVAAGGRRRSGPAGRLARRRRAAAAAASLPRPLAPGRRRRSRSRCRPRRRWLTAGCALFDVPCPFPFPEAGEVEPAPVADGAAWLD